MANVANRKDIREAEKQAKLRATNDAVTVTNLMADVEGRRWVWERLESAHVFTVIPPTDALAMAFAEGERNQGLLLLAIVTGACPNEFIQAMRESNDRRTSTSSREYDRSQDLDWGVDRSDSEPVDGPGPSYHHPDEDGAGNQGRTGTEG